MSHQCHCCGTAKSAAEGIEYKLYQQLRSKLGCSRVLASFWKEVGFLGSLQRTCKAERVSSVIASSSIGRLPRLPGRNIRRVRLDQQGRNGVSFIAG